MLAALAMPPSHWWASMTTGFLRYLAGALIWWFLRVVGRAMLAGVARVSGRWSRGGWRGGGPTGGTGSQGRSCPGLGVLQQCPELHTEFADFPVVLRGF